MKSDAAFIKELDTLDTKDPDFLAKLEAITNSLAAARLENKKAADHSFVAPEDPQDLLNCEGCQ